MLSDAVKMRICLYGAVVLLTLPVLGMFLTGQFEPPPKLFSVPYIAVIIAMLFGFAHFADRLKRRRATRR